MAEEQRTATGKTSFGEDIRGVLTRAEEELGRLVKTLNDEVVPDVRRQGSLALRGAAERLRELAEKLDDRKP